MNTQQICWGIAILAGCLWALLFLGALLGLYARGQEQQDRERALAECRAFWAGRESEAEGTPLFWPAHAFNGSWHFSHEEVFDTQAEPETGELVLVPFWRETN